MVILSDDQIHNEGLPRGYYLKHPPTPRVDNTYLFTEKDTKKRKRDNRQVGLPEIPARFRYNKPRYDAATDIEGSEMDAPSFRKVRQSKPKLIPILETCTYTLIKLQTQPP